MTKEQEQLKQIMDDNAKIQTQAANDNFKRNAREIALRIAAGNKEPSYSQGIGTIGQVRQQSNYNLIDEAEKIYKWLIKDIEVSQSQS